MTTLPQVPVSAVAATAATRRAIRVSFAQSMLGAIYAASTGGMFLIGFAKMLGADNPQIGLMSTFPMLCVFAQLLSAVLVERGVSRRRLTLVAAVANAGCWTLIILIPQTLDGQPSAVKVGALIAIITAVSFFGQISGNARGSWVGDLIPERFRGRFFGRLAMYGGMVATGFAILEGAFLDQIKHFGLDAFSLLFAFGMVFGLLNAALFRAQRDVPVHVGEHTPRFGTMLRQAFANKPLMATMGFMLVFMLQSLAWPFYIKYMLDINVPFLGVGIVNGVMMLTMLICSPMWGKIVGRFGCRPVLIFAAALLAPLSASWLLVDSPATVYCIIGPVNVLAGLGVSGINVGLSTLLYKVTPSAGRSVQLAVNAIIITVIAAPMPWLGGHLPGFLQWLGLSADLRWTFYVAGVFCAAAAFVGQLIHEEGARSVGALLRYMLRLSQK